MPALFCDVVGVANGAGAHACTSIDSFCIADYILWANHNSITHISLPGVLLMRLIEAICIAAICNYFKVHTVYYGNVGTFVCMGMTQIVCNVKLKNIFIKEKFIIITTV